jgi:serine/threonine kinase 38
VICSREELGKLMSEMQLDNKQKEILAAKLDADENAYARLQRKKMTVNDFDIIAIIGRGAFGEVRFHSY